MARALRQSTRPCVVQAVTTAALLSAAASAAGAQDAPPEPPGPPRGIERVSPGVAAPGAQVVVSSGDMPSMTGIRLGIGAADVGFEELTDLVTSEEGEFSVTVTVPAWAERDRVHRFIVFDLYFRPIALSGPFHVTDAEGRVAREGRVTGESEKCVRFVDVDEVEYALEGPPAALPDPEVSVTLEGRLREGSTCGAPFTLALAG
ncbi:MAG TPA: hypothetical protein VK849_09350 [Longimicrobiales bacterium]|nr:hypothetical protein [Longimicrobiales bacterium]